MLEQDKLLWLISQTCLLNNVQISLKGKEYNVLGIIKHLSSVAITQRTKQYLICPVGETLSESKQLHNLLKTFKSKSNLNAMKTYLLCTMIINTKLEYILVGCVPPASVAVSPTHIPPPLPAMHTPLPCILPPRTPPCMPPSPGQNDARF